MVYISQWEEFEAAVKLLYLKDPDIVHYQLKQRTTEGLLTLKVTAKDICVSFKAQNLRDVKKVEHLTANCIRWACLKDVTEDTMMLGKLPGDSAPPVGPAVGVPMVASKRKRKGAKKNVEMAD